MIPIGGGNGGWSGCAPNPGGAATNSQDLVDQLKRISLSTASRPVSHLWLATTPAQKSSWFSLQR